MKRSQGATSRRFSLAICKSYFPNSSAVHLYLQVVPKKGLWKFLLPVSSILNSIIHSILCFKQKLLKFYSLHTIFDMTSVCVCNVFYSIFCISINIFDSFLANPSDIWPDFWLKMFKIAHGCIIYLWFNMALQEIITSSQIRWVWRPLYRAASANSAVGTLLV